MMKSSAFVIPTPGAPLNVNSTPQNTVLWTILQSAYKPFPLQVPFEGRFKRPEYYKTQLLENRIQQAGLMSMCILQSGPVVNIRLYLPNNTSDLPGAFT